MKFCRIYECNNKHHAKGYCRWTTPTENARNKTTVKLSMKKAREIRKLVEVLTVDQLAIKYDVAVGAICAVLANKTWKED